MNRTQIVKCCSVDGRIVIPKHMRDALHLKDSEPLTMRMQDQTLILSRYQELETLESLCGLFLKAYSKQSNCPILICNKEHVLKARGISLSPEPLLSAGIREFIRNDASYIYDMDHPLDLLGNGRYKVNALYPIQGENGPVGAVLLLHYRTVSSSEQLCAKLLADILSEYIINQ